MLKLPFKIALIGAGGVARHGHLPVLRNCPDCHLSVVIDPSEAALQAVKKEFTHVRLYRSLEEADLDKIDCAIVCSPSVLHYAHTRFLLEKGMHVLCEKPLGIYAREAKELVSLAEKKKLVLQAGYNRRYQPVALFLAKAVHSGTYGPLVRVVARGGSIARGLSEAILNPQLSGGGVLMDYGVHFIDRLCSWFDELEVISCKTDSEGGAEANAHVTLRGSNRWSAQVPVELSMSWTTEMGDTFTLEFHNVTIKCTINNGNQYYIAHHRKQTPLLKNIYKDELRTLRGPQLNIMEQQWQEFMQRLSGHAAGPSSLQDAIRTTAVAESCYTMKEKLHLAYGY
ncbi:MAG: hypothetical protein KatS3mg031_1265 [Chitinophagales bacterium]|nr:MAG: hypothetical protein KatS3mg031_1265 [Chitinophagales bacterium]